MTHINPPYRYRPVSDDLEELKELRDRWLGIAVDFGYDVGTKKEPLPREQWKRDPKELKTILEALGLLPPEAVPLDYDAVEAARPRSRDPRDCKHKKCYSCGRCACDGITVSQRKREKQSHCSPCRFIKVTKEEPL